MNTQHPTINPVSDKGNIVSFQLASAANHKNDLNAITEVHIDGMPPGFALRSDGIYQVRQNDGDDVDPVRICSPVVVKGICRNSENAAWGRVVSVQDPDGSWHEVVLEQRELAKKSVAALNSLFDRGLELAPVDKAGQSLAELLLRWRPDGRYLRTDRLGWVDRDFTAYSWGNGRVVGHRKVVTDGVSLDVVSSMATVGTLPGWRETLAAACVGNPLMILAVSHALTGPLLSVLGRDGGGFHFRGVSSRGKSTLLGVAASVWGAPSFVQSWRGTDNGIEGIAAACNDSLLILDELHQVEPRVAGETVYMLANGRGKLRMSSNGQNQSTRHWSVPVLSSGELSLEDHMASGGKKMFAGQDIRLIDLVADSGRYGAFDSLNGEANGRLFAERMQRAGRLNYGSAGPAFVEAVMRNMAHKDSWVHFVNNRCEDWTAKLDLPVDGQIQRVSARFAIAALAGELATKNGITGWPLATAAHAAFDLFHHWFEARDGVTRLEVDEAIERTRSYVTQNLHRFLRLDGSEGTMLDGWRDQDWVYITPESWKAIHDQVDAIEVARLHMSAGLLKTQKGDSLQFRMGRDISGRPRVYAVRLAELLRCAEA